MANFIVELAIWAGEPELIDRWLSAVSERLVDTGEIEVDDYRPYPGREDAAGPRAIVYVGFRDEDAARSWVGNPRVTEVLSEGRDLLGLRLELMEVRAFPIGNRPPQPLRARFSYVVRYELPAEDVPHFQSYYMRMHPPILAEFEAIRNIFCYLPVPIGPEAPAPSSGYLIGNEVVFDSAEDFDRAMASPVRAKSRADFETFPPFSGRNPHYPMVRTRLMENGPKPERS